MSETRKIAAIFVADVVGYSRLAGADEDRTLSRLRGLRSDLIDPAIAAHHGRMVKRTGDGALVEFRSVVDAVRCAIEVQSGMVERNAGVPDDRRIEFRIGVHLGDVVEEADGDLMGDGVNIAARLEGIAKPGADLRLRARLPAGQRAGSISRSPISARPNSKTSPTRSGSLRLEVGKPAARETCGRCRSPVAPGARAGRRRQARVRWRGVGLARRHRRRAAWSFCRRASGPRRSSRTPLRRLPHNAFRSLCCPSPTSLAIPRRITSPTPSPTRLTTATRAPARQRSSSRTRPPLPTRAGRRRQGHRQGARRALCCSRARCNRPPIR